MRISMLKVDQSDWRGGRSDPSLPYPWIAAAMQDCYYFDLARLDSVIDHVAKPLDPGGAHSWPDLAVQLRQVTDPVESGQYFGRERRS
jgi:hypothetical protein